MTSRKPQLRIVSSAAADPAEVGAQPPSLDDSQLLSAVRQGEPRAAGALYDRARPTVDRVIHRLLGSKDSDSPDLAQQSMIEIVLTISRYRGDCSLDSWISTVTAHAIWKHLRRRQIERRLFSDSLTVETTATSAHQPARATVLRGLVDRVLDHLRAIDVGRASVIVLHDVHGYDLREISIIMGISVAAAQTRLSRGRRELHERIALDPDLAHALDRTDGGAP